VILCLPSWPELASLPSKRSAAGLMHLVAVALDVTATAGMMLFGAVPAGGRSRLRVRDVLVPPVLPCLP
jgi:hypothetical protein